MLEKLLSFFRVFSWYYLKKKLLFKLCLGIIICFSDFLKLEINYIVKEII